MRKVLLPLGEPQSSGEVRCLLGDEPWPPPTPDHPLLGAATRCVTRIHGGTGPNIVPGRCEIDIGREHTSHGKQRAARVAALEDKAVQGLTAAAPKARDEPRKGVGLLLRELDPNPVDPSAGRAATFRSLADRHFSDTPASSIDTSAVQHGAAHRC